MGDPIFTAVSGLNAASLRLGVAADNIANSQDTAPLSPQPGQAQPYQPLGVAQSDAAGGGTIARATPVTPASTPAFDPTSPFADSSGAVASPNVDMAQQLTGTSLAQISYDANVQVMTTAQQMQGYLLNLFA